MQWLSCARCNGRLPPGQSFHRAIVLGNRNPALKRPENRGFTSHSSLRIARWCSDFAGLKDVKDLDNGTSILKKSAELRKR